jgi:hypothetical protein
VSVTPSDYDTVGFPLYLNFDGIDDFLVTNSINFTATDKMTVWAGVRKLSTSDAMLAELSNNAASNAGAFCITAPEDASKKYAFSAIGSAWSVDPRSSVTGTGDAPDTSVISGIGDIPLGYNIIRRNGVAYPQSVGNIGIGKFGNYPLYIGRRSGTALPFNGRIYSLIVRGAASTNAEITNAETYINSKTKAY